MPHSTPRDMTRHLSTNLEWSAGCDSQQRKTGPTSRRRYRLYLHPGLPCIQDHLDTRVQLPPPWPPCSWRRTPSEARGPTPTSSETPTRSPLLTRSPPPESEPPPNQPLQPDESSVGSAAGSSPDSSVGASSEAAEPPPPASCWDSAGAADDAASLLALDTSSHPAIPTPRTRARSTGAEVLSSPRRLDVEEGTDETDERENMGEIGGNMGVFTKASSNEKRW